MKTKMKTMVVNDFNRSDSKIMTVLNKAEILCLKSKGKTIKQIAKTTKRSVDWVDTLVDTFDGTPFSKQLISQWEKHIKNETRTNQKELSTTRSKTRTIQRRTNISNSVGKRRNKTNNSKYVKQTVQKRSTRKRRPVLQREIPSSNSKRNGKSGRIVDSLRKHVDYNGE